MLGSGAARKLACVKLGMVGMSECWKVGQSMGHFVGLMGHFVGLSECRNVGLLLGVTQGPLMGLSLGAVAGLLMVGVVAGLLMGAVGLSMGVIPVSKMGVLLGCFVGRNVGFSFSAIEECC